VRPRPRHPGGAAASVRAGWSPEMLVGLVVGDSASWSGAGFCAPLLAFSAVTGKAKPHRVGGLGLISDHTSLL
jgi:hypothetical protein